MFTVAVVGIVTVISIVRARHEGVDWIDIVAWPSRWLHYVSHGGAWGPTFSACVGLHTKVGIKNMCFWRGTERCINTTFWIIESGHCDKALTRTEEYMKRVRTDQRHWGRPEE